MNWLERKFVKFGWNRLEKQMPKVRRWAPLIGSAFLVISVILRTLGYHEFAQTLESLTGAIGLDEQSPVSTAELAMAGAALSGIVLKILARHKAIKAEEYLETRPEKAKVAAVKEALSEPPISLNVPTTVPNSEDVKAVKDVLRAKE